MVGFFVNADDPKDIVGSANSQSICKTSWYK